jgi:hypothetical protein
VVSASIFTARDGAVIFDGKPVPEFRAIAVRQHLVAVALDRAAPEPRAEAFWTLATELRTALTASRDQRRTSNTSASPVVNSPKPQVRAATGQESAR